GVADLLQPAGDGALGDGLAERRHGDVLAGGRTAGRAGLRGGGLLRLTGGRLLVGRGGDGLVRGEVLALGGRLLLGGSLGTGVVGAGALRPGAVADDDEIGADLGVLVLLDQDLLDRPRDGGGDLGVDLVGRDLEQRLVDVAGVADALEPAGDGAL